MASLERQGEHPGVHPHFVWGDSVVKHQIPGIHLKDTESQEAADSDSIILKKSALKHVPDSILNYSSLTYLSLFGNQISSIPESMFTGLPNLQWLDFRLNQIELLPAKIGLHRCLRTLLLEGNPISELPPELGNVISLRGLLLRDCPILFPPADILNQGVPSILQYLRRVLAQRAVCERKTPQELPEMEKLHLSELSEEQEQEEEEAGFEDELQKFMELKEKLIELDEGELCCRAPKDENLKSQLCSGNRRKRTISKAATILKPLPYGSEQCRDVEARRRAAMKELKEKQPVQRETSQESFRMGCAQAKFVHDKKVKELKHKKRERQRKDQKESQSCVEDDNKAHQRFETHNEDREFRSARKLQREIHDLTEKMLENPLTASGSTVESTSAPEDVKEMKRLQTGLLEHKRNPWKVPGNRFKMTTGDIWQSSIENK